MGRRTSAAGNAELKDRGPPWVVIVFRVTEVRLIISSCSVPNGSGARDAGQRERAPEIPNVGEMQLHLGFFAVREKAMVFLGIPAGLCRGELAGLNGMEESPANPRQALRWLSLFWK